MKKYNFENLTIYFEGEIYKSKEYEKIIVLKF